MYYSVIIDADIFIQSGATDIFFLFHITQKSKTAAAGILYLRLWIWPYRRVDSVVFEICTKFGSSICYSNWDRRTYASDVHLMTSRELTSGFDFCSRRHLRMAVMHLYIKYGTDTFIQTGVIVIFPKFKMAAAAILDF